MAFDNTISVSKKILEGLKEFTAALESGRPVTEQLTCRTVELNQVVQHGSRRAVRDVSDLVDQIRTLGFAMLPDVVDNETLVSLTVALEPWSENQDARARGGLRNLFTLVPATRALAISNPLLAIARSVLGDHARPVRAILFDKTPAANWKVAWHQDLTIAVMEPCPAGGYQAGYRAWSTKAGVTHVQPPISVLENMLTLRLHLDPCGPDNGPLRVIPRSHLAGRLNAEEIAAWQTRGTPQECCLSAGGLLAMRPLLLHASSAATTPTQPPRDPC